MPNQLYLCHPEKVRLLRNYDYCGPKKPRLAHKLLKAGTLHEIPNTRVNLATYVRPWKENVSQTPSCVQTRGALQCFVYCRKGGIWDKQTNQSQGRRVERSPLNKAVCVHYERKFLKRHQQEKSNINAWAKCEQLNLKQQKYQTIAAWHRACIRRRRHPSKPTLQSKS